jgi:hypothetical protein
MKQWAVSVLIHGLDFTSAPLSKKPLTCAVGELEEDTLLVHDVKTLSDFRQFEDLLRSPGPWVMGADFPFGQPRRLVENLGWPRSWESCVGHVAKMGKERFESELREYIRGRPPGDKHHMRVVDRLAGAQSPMKLDYVPVGKMFFQGAPRLAASAASILPCRPTADDRVIVEAYPALVARKAVGRTSYKESRTNSEAETRWGVREAILQWLRGNMLRPRYGFSVWIEDDLGNVLVRDDNGDFLDSVMCAVQAAWAYRRRDEGYGIPTNADPLEGWIADPAMLEMGPY